jgi:hypothetical protein
VTRHFFWSGRTTRRQLISGWLRWVKQRLVWSRAARRRWSNGARGKRNGWWPPLVMSRHRDNEASPHGTAMTSGVRSPLRHCVRCCVRPCWQPARAVMRRLRLTSGPQLHFIFSRIFNHPNFEIQIYDLSDVHNSPNFVGR